MGTQTAFTYDGNGNVLSKIVTFSDSSGTYTSKTLYAYTPEGQVYCEVDPIRAAGGVTCPANPPSEPGSHRYDETIYDSLGRVSYTVSSVGGISMYAYDSNGDKYCTVAPYAYANGVRCPSSPPTTAPTVNSDPYLGATIDTFNADDEITQETNPLGGITLKSYDPSGNVLSTTVESNNSTSDPTVVTTSTYDADDQVVSSTLASGSSLAATTLTSYDPDGNAYCSVSANQVAAGSATYQCPPWQSGWILSPPNPSSEYSASPSSTQAYHVTLTFDDADGNQVQSTNPVGATTISVFDGDGRTYCASDATNLSSYLNAHTGANYPYACPTTPPTTAPATGSDPGYAITIYDADGRVLKSSNADGNTTTTTYDPDGDALVVTDPNTHATTNCYYYEISSCAASAPAGGGSGSMLYSTTRPPTSVDPSGELTTYSYNPAGSVATTTTPAGTTTTSYNDDGTVEAVSYSNTASGYATPPTVSYTYWTDGSRATMTDGTGTTTYSYDDAGDLTSQAFVASGSLSNQGVAYSYFSTQALQSVTYPSYGSVSNPQATYTYDDSGAMASVTDWNGNEVTFGHDFDGNTTAQDNEVSTSAPSGTSNTQFTFDPADQSLATTTSYVGYAPGMTGDGCPSSSYSDTYAAGGTFGGTRNSDGEITYLPEIHTNSCGLTFTAREYYSYDPAGQVVWNSHSARQGSAPNNINYDAGGDVTQLYDDATQDTYSQTFDQAGEVLSQSPTGGSGGSASTFGYDSIGDQVSQSSTSTSTYYQTGQMNSNTNGSVTTSYAYTGDGLEASATSGGTTAQLTWSPIVSSLPVVLGDGTNDYIYGAGQTPVEQYNVTSSPPASNPVFLNYGVDDGASSYELTNTSGQLTNRSNYDAFGMPRQSTAAAGTPFGFAGQYSGEPGSNPSGLTNMRARWYNATTGSFTSVDAALSTTDQPYEYAGDDPVNASDPSGLWIEYGYVNSTFTPTQAEKFVQFLVRPADPQVLFQTEIGNRRVDSYGILNAWLNEVKTGTVSNDSETDLQTAKDGFLLQTGEGYVLSDSQSGVAVRGATLGINGDTWWVFPNKAGVSKMTGPQQKALTFDGINALILKYKENGDPVDPAEVGRAAQSKDPQDIRSTLTNAYTSGACGSGSISIVT